MSEYHDEHERERRDFQVFRQASERIDPNGWILDLIDHVKARIDEVEAGKVREIDLRSNDNDYLYRDPAYIEAIRDLAANHEAALDAMIRLIESERVVRERNEAVDNSVREMLGDASATLGSDALMAIEFDLTDRTKDE